MGSAAEVQAIYAAGAAGKPNAVGNTGSGVLIDAGAAGNTIGGTTAQPATSSPAIARTASTSSPGGANTVHGNYVGTDAGRTVSRDPPRGHRPGHRQRGAGNVISGNGTGVT